MPWPTGTEFNAYLTEIGLATLGSASATQKVNAAIAQFEAGIGYKFLKLTADVAAATIYDWSPYNGRLQLNKYFLSFTEVATETTDNVYDTVLTLYDNYRPWPYYPGPYYQLVLSSPLFSLRTDHKIRVTGIVGRYLEADIPADVTLGILQGAAVETLSGSTGDLKRIDQGSVKQEFQLGGGRLTTLQNNFDALIARYRIVTV